MESLRGKLVRICYNQFRGSYHLYDPCFGPFTWNIKLSMHARCFLLLYMCMCLIALGKTTRCKLVSFSTWPTLHLNVYGYPRGRIKSRVHVSNKPMAVPATTWTVDHPPNKGLDIKRFPLFRKSRNIFLDYSVLIFFTRDCILYTRRYRIAN